MIKVGIVYGYYQPLTNKWYIGQTANEEQRKIQHQKSTIKEKTKFGLALNKYGFDSFEYTVLENVVVEFNELNSLMVANETQQIELKDFKYLIDDAEMKHIELKDSFNNGYNLTKGGSLHNRKVKVLKENKIKKVNNKRDVFNFKRIEVTTNGRINLINSFFDNMLVDIKEPITIDTIADYCGVTRKYIYKYLTPEYKDIIKDFNSQFSSEIRIDNFIKNDLCDMLEKCTIDKIASILNISTRTIKRNITEEQKKLIKQFNINLKNIIKSIKLKK